MGLDGILLIEANSKFYSWAKPSKPSTEDMEYVCSQIFEVIPEIIEKYDNNINTSPSNILQVTKEYAEKKKLLECKPTYLPITLDINPNERIIRVTEYAMRFVSQNIKKQLGLFLTHKYSILTQIESICGNLDARCRLLRPDPKKSQAWKIA